MAVASLSVEVSGTNGNDWVLQKAASATEPPADSPLWEPAASGSGDGTVTVQPLVPGTQYWFRARVVGVGQISSPWSTACTSTTSEPDDTSSLTLTEDGCSITATWLNGFAEQFEVEALLDGTLVAVLPPGTTSFTFNDRNSNVQPNTSHTVKIRHRLGVFGEDITTTVGVSDTITTSGGETAPTPGRVVILVGAETGGGGSVTGGDDLTDTGIAVGFVDFDASFGIEIERADDDGAGQPDLANTETFGLPPGQDVLVDRTVDEGDGRKHYRGRSVGGGSCVTAGNWSNFADDLPTTIPETLPDPEDVAESDVISDTTGDLVRTDTTGEVVTSRFS